MMGVTDTENVIRSVQFRNTSTGDNAEMRFVACANDSNYIAFTCPSNNNTGSFFGITKSSGNFIFSAGGTRNMYIGPLTSNSISFCSNGTVRMTVNSDGTTNFTQNISAPNLTSMNTQLTGITETAITKTGTIIGSNVLSNNETRLTAVENKTQNFNSTGTTFLNTSFTIDTGSGDSTQRRFRFIKGSGLLEHFNSTTYTTNFAPMTRVRPIGNHSYEMRVHQGEDAGNAAMFRFVLSNNEGGAVSPVKKGFQFLNWGTEISVINSDGTFSCIGNMTVPSLNGNNIGAPATFRYDAVTPFIPVVASTGIIEVGDRIDFHRVTTEEDYTVGLQVAALNRLSMRHNNTRYYGDLELGTTFYRNTSGLCQLQSNSSSNMLWFNNAGTNTWIMDSTSSGERWSTTRDNASTAFNRSTGIAYNNNFLLQTTDYTTATVISNHLHVNLNGMTYVPLLGMRVHKDDMTSGQEVMIQAGKNHPVL